MTVSDILRVFRDKLSIEVDSSSNQHDFDAGWDGRFRFSPEIREKVKESVASSLAYVLEKIAPRFPPTSRKGRGKDGGTSSTPGGDFNLY